MRRRHFSGNHNTLEVAAELCVAVQPICSTRFLGQRVGGERGCEITPSAAHVDSMHAHGSWRTVLSCHMADGGRDVHVDSCRLLPITALAPLTLRCAERSHFDADHTSLNHSAAWPFGSSLGHPRAPCVT